MPATAMPKDQLCAGRPVFGTAAGLPRRQTTAHRAAIRGVIRGGISHYAVASFGGREIRSPFAGPGQGCAASAHPHYRGTAARDAEATGRKLLLRHK